MNPRVLIIVTSDPRVSPRPAEAIRIAAGVGVWQKVDVTVYLRAAAVLALGEYVDELLEEDNYTRYLPIVGESGRPIYVQRAAPLLEGIGDAPLAFEEIDDARLAALASECDYVLRF